MSLLYTCHSCVSYFKWEAYLGYCLLLTTWLCVRLYRDVFGLENHTLTCVDSERRLHLVMCLRLFTGPSLFLDHKLFLVAESCTIWCVSCCHDNQTWCHPIKAIYRSVPPHAVSTECFSAKKQRAHLELLGPIGLSIYSHWCFWNLVIINTLKKLVKASRQKGTQLIDIRSGWKLVHPSKTQPHKSGAQFQTEINATD